MKILNTFLKPSLSAWLLACLAFLNLPVRADIDADSGRYISFDDYSLIMDGPPATWEHFGPVTGISTARGLQAGTNHIHKSGWSFLHCRIGRNTYLENSVLPILNGNPYVPNGTNYCVYLQNRLEAEVHSPVFTTGVGNLSFNAISLNAFTINMSVYIATNMLNGMGNPVPIDASANTNRGAIVWVPLDTFVLTSGAPEVAYQKELNIRQGGVCFKIVRDNIFVDIVIPRDNYYAVIDDFRVTTPPVEPIYDLDPAEGRYLEFDDYSLTADGPPPTWQHFGPVTAISTARGLQAGTNHVHKSGWSFLHCRIGRNTNVENSVPPILNGNPYVPNGTNYCVYLQNRLEAEVHSPVFTNGVGAIYLDAISLNAFTINMSVYIATNMINGVGDLVPLDASANTNRGMIVWEPLPLDTFVLASGATEIAYRKELNIRQGVCIKIVRDNIYIDVVIPRDNYYAVIDNLRVSPPPADVIMDQGNTPFDAYPSIDNNINLQLKISNAIGPYTSAAAQRTNVFMVSRWNYLGQYITPWTTNALTCVDTGDGLGNNELWQPATPLQRYSDVGDLQYYFVCQFEGEYYQSKDYTVYPVETNLVLFPPENQSPRTYSAAGMTAGSSAATTPFVYSMRLFPSNHDTVKTVLFVNGSSVPEPESSVPPMTLVGTNRWQTKYDIVNHPGVTNLLWYFEATGAYTNNFQTTSEKTYWQNIGSSPIQNGGLPYGDNCELTDASITNRPGSWFGVTTVPGESSYVLFTLDTGRTNYLAGRGEYQNFNAWNVGSVAEGKFTDALDKYPKISYSQNFSTNWLASYFGGKSNWFGVGTFTDITSRQFGPDQILGDVNWLAGAYQQAIERTAINGLVIDAETAIQRRNQGVRLLGGATGLGLGYYQGSRNQLTGINGLGTISFKARLSRPLSEEPNYNFNAAYRWVDLVKSNYMLSAYMRADVASPETPSLSLIAYYQGPQRFYEYRIVQLPDARDVNGTTAVAGRDRYVAHQIWKWSGNNTPLMLAESKRPNTSATALEATYDAKLTDPVVNPTEFRIYTGSTGVVMRVKFKNQEIPFPSGSANFEVVDATSPLLYGGYGFHAADCTLSFTSLGVSPTGPGAIPGSPEVAVIGGSDTGAALAGQWAFPSDLYEVSGNSFISKPLATQVKVQTGTSELGPWTTFYTQTINSYDYQTITATTNSWQSLCAKIQIDNDAENVVIDGVNVTSWRAETVTASPSDDWLITEGWLSYDSTNKWYAHFDASQADLTLAQGLRSRRVQGLGSIVFDYRVPVAPARLKLQYTESAYPQDDTPGSPWVDITNLTFTASTSTWVNVNLFLGMAPATNLYVRLLNDMDYSPTSIIDLRNITIWNNPTNSPNDWVAYNMKITATETNKWWLDSNRSGYMNNHPTNDTIATRPMIDFNPSIMAPRLTRGLGTVSFLARAFTTNYVAGETNTSITIYATTDEWNMLKPDLEWTKLYTFNNITNAFYRPFFYSHPTLPNTYKAVKLVVDGVIGPGTPERVCIDEIVLTEAVYPRFDITDVRLLLPTLSETLQPMEGDDIGIEAKLTNVLLDPQNISLYVTYVLGTNTWGVLNAPESNRVTKALMNVTNNTYRTPGDFMINGIPEQEKYTVVQYLVWAEYYRAGSSTVYTNKQTPDTANNFVNPSWYRPVNLNKVGNVETGVPKATWSPYYIVYDVPPGSVWINELNLLENDLSAQNRVFMNPYIEIAQPSWMNLEGWTVEVLDLFHQPRLTKTITPDAPVASADSSGYGLFVIGNELPVSGYPSLTSTTVVHDVVFGDMRGQDAVDAYYPGGYRLKRPMGMYEQAIVYDWDPAFFSGEQYVNDEPFPQTPFTYVGREFEEGSLSFTGNVTIAVGRYERTDSTNSWQPGVATFNWTPGRKNSGQIFPNSPMPGGSNVLITSTFFSLNDSLMHGWQNGSRQNPLVFKMKKGQGTNFVYVAEPWFRFYEVKSNNVELLLGSEIAVYTNYSVALMDVQTNTSLVVKLGLTPEVTNVVKTADQINWLQQYNDRPLAPTYFGADTLGLLEEYWLDLDPTETNRLIFATKAIEPPDVNGFWLTLEMAKINGLGQTNKVEFLRGDAKVAVWVSKTLAPDEPRYQLMQYYISSRSFDDSFLARTRINAYTNTTATFRWTLDRTDLRYATYELINTTNSIPGP